MRTEALGGIGRTGHVGIGSLIASMSLLGWKYGLDMIVGLSAPKKIPGKMPGVSCFYTIYLYTI